MPQMAYHCARHRAANPIRNERALFWTTKSQLDFNSGPMLPPPDNQPDNDSNADDYLYQGHQTVKHLIHYITCAIG
jgi:hypothetical protein